MSNEEDTDIIPITQPAVVNHGYGFIKEANVTAQDISVVDAELERDKVIPPDHLSIAHFAHLAKMTWVFKANPVRWACYDPFLPEHRTPKHRARVIPEKLHSPEFFTASFKQEYEGQAEDPTDTSKKHYHRWLHSEHKTLREAFDWLEARWSEHSATQVSQALQS